MLRNYLLLVDFSLIKTLECPVQCVSTTLQYFIWNLMFWGGQTTKRWRDEERFEEEDKIICCQFRLLWCLCCALSNAKYSMLQAIRNPDQLCIYYYNMVHCNCMVSHRNIVYFLLHKKLTGIAKIKTTPLYTKQMDSSNIL